MDRPTDLNTPENDHSNAPADHFLQLYPILQCQTVFKVMLLGHLLLGRLD